MSVTVDAQGHATVTWTVPAGYCSREVLYNYDGAGADGILRIPIYQDAGFGRGGALACGQTSATSLAAIASERMVWVQIEFTAGSGAVVAAAAVQSAASSSPPATTTSPASGPRKKPRTITFRTIRFAPTAYVGLRYRYPFPKPKGGYPPFRFSLRQGLRAPLPRGVSLNPSSGVLAGVPASGAEKVSDHGRFAGLYTFTVCVTDSQGYQRCADSSTGFQVYAGEYAPNHQGISLGKVAPPYAFVGKPYRYVLPGPHGGSPPYRFSTRDGALPRGLRLDPAGVISGAAAPGTERGSSRDNPEGSYELGICATDSAGRTACVKTYLDVAAKAG